MMQTYFEWICDKIGSREKTERFRNLLLFLYRTEFTYIISRDANRVEDGLSLRYRYHYETGLVCDHRGPCSVLEMIVALAIRCEENIMDDPDVGDRTGQWVWGMIVNLGLGSMDNARFDDISAREIIDRFLDREYDPDGRGGLFTIKRCHCDLRDVEIWYQLNWYLNSIT